MIPILLFWFAFVTPQISVDQINRINQACYDNRADYWNRFPYKDQLPGLVTKYYKPELGKKVLDVGSGTGILAKWLSDTGFEVLCLDPSSEMVRRCRKKGLHILQTTIQDYNAQDQFGMIFAILSLIHVPKSQFQQELSKIASLLSKGGVFFLGMIEGHSEGIQEQDSTYPRFFATYSKDEIVKFTYPLFTLKEYKENKGSICYQLFVFEKS